jgi:phosphonate transport system substrate-binding protein
VAGNSQLGDFHVTLRYSARRIFLAVLALLLSSTLGRALDSRFKDANGDLLADTPADAKEQVDPGTLIFAYTPVEDPEVYRKVWTNSLLT